MWVYIYVRKYIYRDNLYLLLKNIFLVLSLSLDYDLYVPIGADFCIV